MSQETMPNQEPPAQSIAAVQQELIEDFSLFDDWMDRYQHIIDLGRKLPPFPEEWRIDANKVSGCQSQVWLHMQRCGARLHLAAASDSTIVSGLIALLLRVYHNRTPQEILLADPSFIGEIGLDTHLSPSRRNGLHAMLKTIRGTAAALETVESD